MLSDDTAPCYVVKRGDFPGWLPLSFTGRGHWSQISPTTGPVRSSKPNISIGSWLSTLHWYACNACILMRRTPQSGPLLDDVCIQLNSFSQQLCACFNLRWGQRARVCRILHGPQRRLRLEAIGSTNQFFLSWRATWKRFKTNKQIFYFFCTTAAHVHTRAHTVCICVLYVKITTSRNVLYPSYTRKWLQMS